jgi:hypothetical protein
MYMRTGFEQKAAWVLSEDLTIVTTKQRRPDVTRELLVRAEAIAEDGEDLSALAQVRWYRGWLELTEGRTADAKVAFGRSMGGFADLNSEGAAWDVRCALALTALAEGDVEAAADVAKEAATVPEARAGLEIQACILLEAGELDLVTELIERDDTFPTGGFNHQAATLRAWLALYQDRYGDSIDLFVGVVSFLIEKQWCRALHSDLLVGLAAARLGAGLVASAARTLGASTLVWNGLYLGKWSVLPMDERVRDACRAALGATELERLEEEGRSLWNKDPSAFVSSSPED